MWIHPVLERHFYSAARLPPIILPDDSQSESDLAGMANHLDEIDLADSIFFRDLEGRPDKTLWLDSMRKEDNALILKGTYEDLPADKKNISLPSR